MDFVMKQALGGEAQAPHPHPQPGSEPRWERALAHQTPLFPTLGTPVLNLSLPNPSPAGATKDMGKMLGGEEEKDPDAQKKEEERQEALRQQEEERKAKHARMEAEREKVRQQIRDKVSTTHLPALECRGTGVQWVPKPWPRAFLNPSSDLRPKFL